MDDRCRHRVSSVQVSEPVGCSSSCRDDCSTSSLQSFYVIPDGSRRRCPTRLRHGTSITEHLHRISTNPNDLSTEDLEIRNSPFFRSFDQLSPPQTCHHHTATSSINACSALLTISQSLLNDLHWPRPKTGGSTIVCRPNRPTMMMSLAAVVLLVMLLLVNSVTATQVSAPVFTSFSDSDLRTYRGNTSWIDLPYFFTLYFDPADQSQLYVGALDYIYRLNADNINEAPFVSRNLTEAQNFTKAALFPCMQIAGLANMSIQCRNHIRTIYRIANSSDMYVCSTGAFSPQEYYLLDDQSQIIAQQQRSGNSKCPYDPLSNYAYVYVDHGNPGNLPALYTAVATDSNSAYVEIIRPPIFLSRTTPSPYKIIKTAPYSAKWINIERPVFVVAVFESGPYVYYFFRELALESTNYCSETYYSRVARVCKMDAGGPAGSTMENRFTSFLKARLVCSITTPPSTIPYQFNEIYDVKFDVSSQTFYALFKTNSDGRWGSAVCRYSLSSIDQAFNTSQFLEQSSPTSAWQPVPSNVDPPDPPPGQCSNNTKNYKQATLDFINGHLLMAATISPAGGGGQAMYYSRELAFDKLEVDLLSSITTVLYLCRQDASELHRIVVRSVGAAVPSFWTASILKPFVSSYRPPAINAMMFHATSTQKWLYISTDTAVHQLSPAQCTSYSLCSDCVRDPYCGWDVGTANCQPYQSGLLQTDEQSAGVDGLDVCADNCLVKYKRESTIPGMAIHLNCSSHCKSTSGVRWWFKPNNSPDFDPVDVDKDENFVISRDDGLTILMVNETKHYGLFECRSSGGTNARALAQHNVTMSVCRYGNDVREVFIAAYVKWCQEFSHYYKDMGSWRCLKDHCVASNCMPNANSCAASP